MIPAYWSPTKKLMVLGAMAGGKLVEDTVTGNPLTFITDVSKPLKSLVANFLPVQASGTPSLENILPITGWDAVNVFHSGVNVFDGILEKGYINDQGQNEGTGNIRSKGYISVVPLATYRVVFTPTSVSAYDMKVFYYEKDKTFIRSAWKFGGESITIPENAYFIRFHMDSAYTAGTDRDIAINYPSTETGFVPYNGTVYPVVFPAVGKNLFNGQYVKGLITGNTSQGYTWNSNSTNANSAIIPCEPNTTYTVKKHTSSNRFSVATCPVYPTQGQPLTLVVENALLSEYTFTTGADAHYIVVYVSTGTEQAEPDMMVNTGSSALPYEPFDNTVFGGYYNLITGELWATYESVDMGSVEWVIHNNTGTRQAWKAVFSRIKKGKFGTAFDGFSEAFKSVAYTATWTPYIMAEDESRNIYICFEPSAYSTSEEVQTALDGILLVYPLAEPVLITTLTPQQINAIKGNNTVWSEADGSMTAVYLKKG